jgi:hypothetical protein
MLRGMPVEFLTDAEAAVFGRYAGPPTRAELDRMFYLDDADMRLAAKRRGDHMRLGFALQLTTVRYLGTFLTDPLDVPPLVTEHLAGQLRISDPACAARYAERRTTPLEHRDEIKAEGGLREFTEAEGEFAAWVHARAWNTGDGPKTIFTDGVRWLAVTESALRPAHKVSGPRLLRLTGSLPAEYLRLTLGACAKHPCADVPVLCGCRAERMLLSRVEE